MSESMGKLRFIPAALGFMVGILTLLLMDSYVPHQHLGQEEAEGVKKNWSCLLYTSFHTTPVHVNAAFEMLKMNAISADDFVQNEYQIEDIEKAILEHASGAVIKNAIVYPED